MLTINFFIHILGILLVFFSLGASILFWVKYRKDSMYTKIAYWKYVTIGLFFLLVYTYADMYTQATSSERAFYAYMTELLLLLSAVFIFIAVKRFITSQQKNI